MGVRRLWALPLLPLYAAGLAWKSRGFDQHPERARRLADPVVSVGSLSAGGAGKTPFAMALAEAVRRAGWGIDVLTRGHGRGSTGDLRVHPGGSADEFGDEPLLLARRLACPVYVARERFHAGEMAERDRHMRRESHGRCIHLLDDGFQHRQLARAVDIVLFTQEDAADVLLPAGNLREPLRALRRADIVVLRSAEASALRPVLERIFAERRQPAIWLTDRHPAVVEGSVSPRPLAFCGIARPEAFRASLHQLALEPARFVALKDHQRYPAGQIERLVKAARAAHAEGFVTTAKDAVKLDAAARSSLLPVGPLAVCDISVALHEEAECVAQMLALVEARTQGRRP